MKTMLRLAAVVAAVALAVPAAAQESTSGRVGIGVGLPTSELGALFTGGDATLPAQIYVPINLLPNLRVEPQIGILSVDRDDTFELSVWSIGAGVFYMMPLGQQAQLYVGPRLVLSLFNEKDWDGPFDVTEREGTDLYIAAALGGELQPHPRISVGAEAQLGYFNIGDRDVTRTGNPTVTEPGGSSIQTQGVIFVRVYLF